MQVTQMPRVAAVFVLLVIILGGMNSAPRVQAAGNFADPAFYQVWQRTDAPIAEQKVSRSYYWGPQPGYSTEEDFADAPGGKRLVQYFDKSRMEINDPNADKSSKFYVTNGLLAKELLSGKMQLGNNTFVAVGAPNIPLASDPDDPAAPTYASFGAALNIPPNHKLGDVVSGDVVSDVYQGESNPTLTAHLASYNVKYAYTEPTTGYSIPDLFWQFLNQRGTVLVGGQWRTEPLSDPWFYATGYPITNAYWAQVKIAGKPNTDVLIQAFERRILTYVPSAPAGYQVQMGNVGQHYFQWRYGSDPAHPIDLLARCGSSLHGYAEGFSRFWAQYTNLHAALGCPQPSDNNQDYTQGPVIQSFEHGLMVSLTFINQSNGAQSKSIYVLYDDGTMQRYDDTFVDGTTEPSSNPPAGRYAPKYGFGKVWREHPEVQNQLGWATTHEWQTRLGEYAFTAHGLLISPPLDTTNVYVLYGNANLDYIYGLKAGVGQPPALTNCQLPADFPSNGMARAWRNSTSIQQQLGCPDDTTSSVAPQLEVAIQEFQYGEMLYVNHINHPDKMSISPVEVYALLPDGSLYAEYNFNPGDARNTAGPPAGLYAPGDKFDQYWRSNSAVSQELGWATGPQQDVSSADHLTFERGLMVSAYGEIRYIFSADFEYFLYSELWGSYAAPH